MQNTSRLLRAITAVFARRILTRVAWMGLAVLALLSLVIILLIAKVSAWWAVAWVILAPMMIIGTMLFLTVWFLSGQLLPRRLTQRESRDIQIFTSKVFELSGRVKTPWPLLALSIIKSVLLRRESNVLNETISDSVELKNQFIRLRDSMEP